MAQTGHQPRRIDRINAVSFADWYLLQEFFKSYEAAFVTSDFMWKDTDDATTPERARRSASGSGHIDFMVMGSEESEPRRDHQLTCDQTVVGVEHRQR